MVINSSEISHMPTLLQNLHSKGISLDFFAIYDDRQIKEFEKLCTNHHHRVSASCNGIQLGKGFFSLQSEYSTINGIAVDIRMAEFDRYEFVQFVQTQIKLPLYVTYDCNDSTIEESLLENAINHIKGNANSWIASLGLPPKKRDHATQTDEFTLETFSDIFKPVRNENHSKKNNGNEKESPISLAFLKNPKYDDSKVTGVSTQLFLGLPEKDSNYDSNKRKRKQR